MLNLLILENSKISDPHRLLLNKYVAFLNLSTYYTWRNHTKITNLTRNALLDGPYSVSHIQDYFEYILKNMRQLLIFMRQLLIILP